MIDTNTQWAIQRSSSWAINGVKLVILVILVYFSQISFVLKLQIFWQKHNFQIWYFYQKQLIFSHWIWFLDTQNRVLLHCEEAEKCIFIAFYCLSCETQPPASIGWVALSSIFVVCSSRIRDTSSHLHYMMFQTIQTIYFLWGYDPGNMSVSFALYSLLSWAQFTVV